jgi:hypothetical protein
MERLFLWKIENGEWRVYKTIEKLKMKLDKP